MPDSAAAAVPVKRSLIRRLMAGFGLALVIALSAYLLFNMSKPGSFWLGSLWFLALLPAALSALICYIGDPIRPGRRAFIAGFR